MKKPESSAPRVLLLSGYDAASHKRWRQDLTALLPGFYWHTLALPPRYFRWRIRGNPLSWLNEPCFQENWDVIIATSMVDLATLRGMHPRLARTPCVLYMHENQFAFPVSSRQNASADPQMVNLYSALAADVVVFNSAWNTESFLTGAQSFLERLPDKVPEGVVADIRNKSRVIPVPIADRLFVDRPEAVNRTHPHLLWNHRWEYDKGPERLLKLLQVLDQRACPFRLSVVGERFRRYPEVFDRIRKQFNGRIQHWGFLASREDYDRLLGQADIVVSTALHDFQGLSMQEAMASGCLPLAPDRLAYREYVPQVCRYASFTENSDREAEAAAQCLVNMTEPGRLPDCRPENWRASVLAGEYQALLKDLLSG